MSNCVKKIFLITIVISFLSGCLIKRNGKTKLKNFKGNLYYTNVLPSDVEGPDRRLFIKFYRVGIQHGTLSSSSIEEVYNSIDEEFDIESKFLKINKRYKYEYKTVRTVGVGNGKTEKRTYWNYCHTLGEVSDTIIIETHAQSVKRKQKTPHIYKLEYYKYIP